MSEEALKALSDRASEAHARIQATYQHINPVVGVRRGMRDSGIPADAMTIDCLQTRRRILMILHDGEPDVLLYQFGCIDEDARATISSVSPLTRWTLRGCLSGCGTIFPTAVHEGRQAAIGLRAALEAHNSRVSRMNDKALGGRASPLFRKSLPGIGLQVQSASRGVLTSAWH